MTAPARSQSPSPLLSISGAVGADAPDEGVAAHYGDPLREQRILTEGSGLVDLSHRPVLRITGADRLSWLHSLTTQHLTEIAPGVGTETLVLSPQGHVEHHLSLVDDGTSVWAHVEPGTAEALVKFLDSMRFFMDVQVSDVSADFAVLWLPGRRDDVGAVAWRAAQLGVEGEAQVGVDAFVPRSVLADLARTIGSPVGIEAYEALRVAAGVPRLGRDTDHRTIPHEVDWLRPAVHLNKGCYRGQETVARVYNLGRPPRRLVRLQLDGSVDRLPAHGDAVFAGDADDASEVGFVGTAVRHHEYGPIALALIKRGVAADAVLTVDGIPGTQEEIVPAEQGPHVVIPKMGRGIRPGRS